MIIEPKLTNAFHRQIKKRITSIALLSALLAICFYLFKCFGSDVGFEHNWYLYWRQKRMFMKSRERLTSIKKTFTFRREKSKIPFHFNFIRVNKFFITNGLIRTDFLKLNFSDEIQWDHSINILLHLLCLFSLSMLKCCVYIVLYLNTLSCTSIQVKRNNLWTWPIFMRTWHTFYSYSF